MKRLLQDPLVVFLLIGGGIFFLYSRLNPSTETMGENPYRIEITGDIQDLLVSEWSARWNRAPNADEFKGLLDSHIKEELLFREAIKLGLDQSDSIIRRRLAQKMEFLTSDIADLENVSEAVLQAFYEQKADTYQIPAELEIQQIYFSTDKRKDAPTDALALLPRLNDGSLSFENAVEASDRTLLNPEIGISPLPQIARQFGSEFAEAIADRKPGDWFGPVQSGYGFHLVKILKRTEGRIPPLATIEEKVLNDYRHDQREKLNAGMLAALLEKYEIVIASREKESTEPRSKDES